METLVAVDPVPGTTNGILALLVIIGTFSSGSLVIETEHCWPRQLRTEGYFAVVESHEG